MQLVDRAGGAGGIAVVCLTSPTVKGAMVCVILIDVDVSGEVGTEGDEKKNTLRATSARWRWVKGIIDTGN